MGFALFLCGWAIAAYLIAFKLGRHMSKRGDAYTSARFDRMIQIHNYMHGRG